MLSFIKPQLQIQELQKWEICDKFPGIKNTKQYKEVAAIRNKFRILGFFLSRHEDLFSWIGKLHLFLLYLSNGALLSSFVSFVSGAIFFSIHDYSLHHTTTLVGGTLIESRNPTMPTLMFSYFNFFSALYFANYLIDIADLIDPLHKMSEKMINDKQNKENPYSLNYKSIF